MPDLDAAAPWIFVALLFVVAIAAARSLRGEQGTARESLWLYPPAPPEGPPPLPSSVWDFWHDDYDHR